MVLNLVALKPDIQRFGMEAAENDSHRPWPSVEPGRDVVST